MLQSQSTCVPYVYKIGNVGGARMSFLDAACSFSLSLSLSLSLCVCVCVCVCVWLRPLGHLGFTG